MGCGASGSMGSRGASYTAGMNNSVSSQCVESTSLRPLSPSRFTTQYAFHRPDGISSFHSLGSEVLHLHSAPNTVEEFVFGDFKIDAKISPRRILAAQTRPKMSRRMTLGTSEGSWFRINDFCVRVDEGDDFELFEEAMIPAGFRRLRTYTLEFLRGAPSRVKSLAIAPHERFFAFAQPDDSNVVLRKTATGEEITTFVGHLSPVLAIAFSKDGKFLATSSRDFSVMVWDVASTKEFGRKQIRCLGHVSLPICVTFSWDGKNIITGCQNKTCFVWDIYQSVEIAAFEEHEGFVVSVASQQGNSLVASGGSDHVVRLWDMHTGIPMQKFEGHEGVILSVAFSWDGNSLLTSDDRSCKLWSLRKGNCVINISLQSLLLSVSSRPQAIQCCNDSQQQYGFAPNGILGRHARGVFCATSNREVLTTSCFCPGDLSNSYFAIATSQKTVFIVTCLTGDTEVTFTAKCGVFTMAAGQKNTLLLGDAYGNICKATMQSGACVPAFS